MEEKDGPQNYQQSPAIETVGKFFEQNLHQIAHTNTTINRFLSAFIDHVRIVRGKKFEQTEIIFFSSNLGSQRFGLYHPRENNFRIYFRL